MKHLGKRLSLIVTILFTASVVLAGNPASFDAGMKSYRAKDYKSAVKHLTKSANDGHGESQYRLGKIYEEGYLGKPDHAKMRHWYQKAADNGHAKSQFKIGSGYARGIGGLPRDPKKAEAYMLKAANAGYKKAMKTLGKLYSKGKYGFPRDKKKGKYWTRKYEKSK